MPSDLLSLQNISKIYTNKGAELEVLCPVGISVKKGEFVCIIGPNGCGKSTLLKIIAGILPPSNGDVTGTEKIAYLPQQPSLLPWRTVLENLALPYDLKRTVTEKTKKTAQKMLKDFDLSQFANFYPEALSGGMQQKVALLRTLLSKPELMLLDEPFSALDAITRLELQQWTTNLWQKTQPGVICVTHDINEAVFLADTIYVFSPRPGRIKQKIEVNLPRSRQRKHMLSPEAKKLENKLNKLLVGSV